MVAALHPLIPAQWYALRLCSTLLWSVLIYTALPSVTRLRSVPCLCLWINPFMCVRTCVHVINDRINWTKNHITIWIPVWNIYNTQKTYTHSHDDEIIYYHQLLILIPILFIKSSGACVHACAFCFASIKNVILKWWIIIITMTMEQKTYWLRACMCGVWTKTKTI